MAIVIDKPTQPKSIFARPTNSRGVVSWLTTVDHKRLGVMYAVAALVLFGVAGLEALLIRAQLAGPNMKLITADQYNQIFTVHGVTMVFWVIMPLGAALMNYLVPLQIGARDVAFPRMNATAYWTWLFTGLFAYSSVLISGAPDGTWVGYAPLSTGTGPNPMQYGDFNAIDHHTARMIFYSFTVQFAGFASLMTAVNMITTIFNERCKGMTMMRVPVFTWMTLVTAFLMLFSIPLVGMAVWQMLFEVRWKVPFYDSTQGGDPILYQHLFWLFGHPEVYIIILPVFGAISDILPTFSRKPLFGQSAVIFSGITIGFLGMGVWAHHMFTAGMGPIADAGFGIATMLIAIPTGVKVLNWMATMWGGQLRFKTPMVWAIGMVSMFMLGGLSGITHAVVPHNTQQHDTYYVVGHFHFVLFGGGMIGMFAAIYFWFPKVFGLMLNERLGHWHFWLTLLGFNLSFGPMHLLGLNGMPRRYYTYADGMGWNVWNIVVGVGTVIIAFAMLIFIWNIIQAFRNPVPSGPDPWDARNLEWATASPPPIHNFDHDVEVFGREAFWARKYTETPTGAVPNPIPEGVDPDNPGGPFGDQVSGKPASELGIHMPSPSWYPIILALGIPIAGYGAIAHGWTQVAIFFVGGVLIFGSMLGWALEPSAEEH